MPKKDDYIYTFFHENKVTICHGEPDDELMKYHDVVATRYNTNTGDLEVYQKDVLADPKKQKYRWTTIEGVMGENGILQTRQNRSLHRRSAARASG